MSNEQGQELKVLSVAGLAGETPKAVKVAYRTLMGLGLCWGILQSSFPEIPAHTADVINRLVLVGIPLIYAVCQTFGWKKPE